MEIKILVLTGMSLFLLLILCVPFFMWREERNLRIKAEENLSTIKEISELEDQIHRFLMSSYEESKKDSTGRVQQLISRRDLLRKEYSDYLGFNTK